MKKKSLVQTGMTMVMLQAMVHPMVPSSSRITWFARDLHITLDNMGTFHLHYEIYNVSRGLVSVTYPPEQ